jgi:hypothetical protein
MPKVRQQQVPSTKVKAQQVLRALVPLTRLKSRPLALVLVQVLQTRQALLQSVPVVQALHTSLASSLMVLLQQLEFLQLPQARRIHS